MQNNMFEIDNRKIGVGYPCFIIAEAGVNHNGDSDMARQLVDAAVDAKADAVKFQTFKAENLVTEDAPKAQYQQETTDENESQFDMIKRLELSPFVYKELMEYCEEQDIIFLASAFDEESVKLLAGIDIAAFKIPSGELTNLPMLSHMSQYLKPLIISTGMAYLSEVEAAVRTIREAGNNDFAILQCVSNYPADPSDVNLRAMQTMKQAFDVPVGYSDHTLGIEVALAAVAMGASVIEKHLTLDRDLPGPDHRASLEPAEFKDMVKSIRIVESSIGHGRKEPVANESDTLSAARKFLVASSYIPAGTILTRELISVKRAGSGLEPALIPHLVGRTIKSEIPVDGVITWDHLA